MDEADTLPPIEDAFKLPFLETKLARNIFYGVVICVFFGAVAAIIVYILKKNKVLNL